MKDNLERHYKELSRRERSEWLISKYPHKDDVDENLKKGLLYAFCFTLAFTGLVYIFASLIGRFFK